MNSNNTPHVLLDSMIQCTATSWKRIAMKAPFVGHKRRAEQFARRVRFPRFAVAAAA